MKVKGKNMFSHVRVGVPFRPLVYNTLHARTVEDSTVVREVDMSLTRGMRMGEAVRETNVLGTAEGKHGSNVWTGEIEPVVMARLKAMESARGDQSVSELQAGVRAIESQLVQITQLLVGMSGCLGETHSQVSSPRNKEHDNMPPKAGVSTQSGVKGL